MIPELRRRLPDLRPPVPEEPETARYRLFEAVVGLLAEISTATPVLMVLDDLHWADRPTLLLLHYLARAPQPTRLLILGASRPTERGDEGFDAWLADLRRDRLVTQIDVAGLAQPETVQRIRVRTGVTPSRGFSEALHEETEGNPLFIEEIVRHLVDAGVQPQQAGARELQRFGLPEGVKEVIARRLARLGEKATEWLRVAAVTGRDFDASILEQLLAFDEDEFLGALDDGLASGLVVESADRPWRYSFSHALIRETLYEGMSEARRTRIHRRVGDALEGAGAGRHLNELALHFTRAADPRDAERAIGYAPQAGEQATAMLAHEEAADHYARALDVLERTEPDALPKRCELLLALGEAQVRSGERALAWQALREAAAVAARLGDSTSLARAAVGASRRYVQPPGVVDEELIAMLEQALAMTTDERTVMRVRLLGRLCGGLYYSRKRDRMVELSAEATAIAAELGDPEARALAAAARRRAFWGPRTWTSGSRTPPSCCAALRGRRRRADPARSRVADGRSARVRRSRCRRGPVGGLRRGGSAAASAALPVERGRVAGDACAARRTPRAGRRAGLRGVGRRAAGRGVTALQYYDIQLLVIRREQGRIGELEPAARQLVAANPQLPAWRAALATLLSEAGATTRPGTSSSCWRPTGSRASRRTATG